MEAKEIDELFANIKEAHKREVINFSRIGERMRLARKTAGKTLEMVASETGIAKATLSRLENGKANITLFTFLTVLHAIHADVYIMFDGND